MSCSDLVSILFAASLFGCVQHSDLGGQKQAECGPECLLDAGSLPIDAGPKRPDARIMSESPEKLVELVEGMSGLWWGFSDDGDPFVDGVDRRALFEVSFVSDMGGEKGTFVVRCLKEPECDPFGFGSASAEGGSFRIINVDPNMGGSGELSWVVSGSPALVASFRSVRRMEVGGPALTFYVGLLNGGPQARLVRRVVLVLGAWPGEDAGTADGGTLDEGMP